jgi:hypothetical protein
VSRAHRDLRNWRDEEQAGDLKCISETATPGEGGCMKTPRLFVALTIINVIVLVFTLAQQVRPVVAQADPPLLRGRGLEIVDGQRRVRASIGVMPGGRSERGDAYPETVLLRLITERGRPSVKLSATEPASGLSLAGPSGTKDTYLILEASGNSSSLKLRAENGKEQLIRP